MMVTAVRAVIVLVYALLGCALCGNGTSAGDLTAMVVFAVIALVAILAADWIADAPRRER